MMRLSAVSIALLSSSLALGQLNAPSSPAKVVSENSGAATPASGTHVAMGEPLEWALPKYPKQARKAGIQGDAVLMLSIDANGTSKAAHGWKYVPYDINGKAVAVTTKVLARFSASETKPAGVTVAFETPPAPHFDSVYKVGNGVTPPQAIYAPDPAYSEEAQAAKYQGTCILSLVVGPDGRPYDIKVTRRLGGGLDEKAIEAVRQWKFGPARKDGRPVPVAINVEIQFRLN